MADLLEGIVARVREQLTTAPPDVPGLQDLAQGWTRRDFRAAIEAGPRPALIAEFKRRSPSKGPLREDALLPEYCRAYAKGGASALSILTNSEFGGDLLDLRQARESVDLPLLRKDFIVDERQLLEAAARGADCVLLIARIVAPSQLVDLALAARSLSLQTLVEIYDESELDGALAAQPDLLGVNSRDLATFAVDSSKFERVAARLPKGLPLVAESGVTSRDQAAAAHAAGARAVLVGEALMTAPDPAGKAHELVGVVHTRNA
ncbi:MAG TPA: indole-3-glycerol phosphate synthase TrpC [Candidatus Dormibacteraeota bacterium]|nr:indole-3-glycerol phosphate synthase TrpC [Candidatus Dormibacteraeota bacterium]